ncbi:hypothetical protein ILYODFUR_005715 [Ilyodon furcidens]|uniref:Uncharacterized protein n=1 Tax=Ilyodon furcidens TaxID=33524 RepID=A0ABV0SUG6_9TELE
MFSLLNQYMYSLRRKRFHADCLFPDKYVGNCVRGRAGVDKHIMYLWSRKDAWSTLCICKPRFLILMVIVHLGIYDGMERKRVWAEEAEGVMETKDEGRAAAPSRQSPAVT